MSAESSVKLVKPLQILQEAECAFQGDVKKGNEKIAGFIHGKSLEAEHFLEAQASLLAEKKEFAGIIFESNIKGGLGVYYLDSGSLVLSLKGDRLTQTFAHESTHAIEDVHKIDSEIKVQAYLRSINPEPTFFGYMWQVLPENIRDKPPQTIGSNTKEAAKELGSYVNEGLFEEIINTAQIKDKFVERFSKLTEGKVEKELEEGKNAQNAIALSIYDYNQKKLEKLRQIHPISPLIDRIEEIQAQVKLAYDRALASPVYKVELEKLIAGREKAEAKRSKIEDKSAIAGASSSTSCKEESSSEDGKRKDKKPKLSEGEDAEETRYRKTVGSFGEDKPKLPNQYQYCKEDQALHSAKDDIGIRDGGIPSEVCIADNLRRSLSKSNSFKGYSASMHHISKARKSGPNFP